MIYYIRGNNLGLYPTPSTDREIRIHFNYTPTDLSGNTDALALDDEFKDAIVFGSALKACKRRLRARNPEKYIPLQIALEKDFNEERERVLGMSKDGEAFVTMDSVSF